MSVPLHSRVSGWEHRVVDLEEGAGFFANTIVRVLSLAALLPTLTSICLLAYFIRPTGVLIVLHYNVYFGVDLLGAWWQAYIFPACSLLFFAGHFLLARYFYQHAERIAAYILLLAAGLISCGVLIVSVEIALINY